MRPGLLQENRIRIALYLADVVGRDVEYDVNAAGQELGDPRLLVDQRTENELGQRGRTIPIIGIGGQRDADVVIP